MILTAVFLLLLVTDWIKCPHYGIVDVCILPASGYNHVTRGQFLVPSSWKGDFWVFLLLSCSVLKLLVALFLIHLLLPNSFNLFMLAVSMPRSIITSHWEMGSDDASRLLSNVTCGLLSDPWWAYFKRASFLLSTFVTVSDWVYGVNPLSASLVLSRFNSCLSSSYYRGAATFSFPSHIMNVIRLDILDPFMWVSGTFRFLLTSAVQRIIEIS